MTQTTMPRSHPLSRLAAIAERQRAHAVGDLCVLSAPIVALVLALAAL